MMLSCLTTINQSHNETAYKSAIEKARVIQANFEKERQSKTKEIAAMRISIDARFQKVIDQFMNQLSDTQE